MPLYEYEHLGEGCDLGKAFEITQSMKEDRLAQCPQCGLPVERLISRTFLMAPKSDTDLRNMGFTKLVKRDEGVYENVTRRGSDAKFMERGKNDTLPNLAKTITD